MSVTDTVQPSLTSALEAKLINLLPAPVRFLTVGVVGLTVDMGVFTYLSSIGVPMLLARALSLFTATVITWRLNRALTFQATGRRRRDEILRYAIVTSFAQGSSYLTFAILISLFMAHLPLGAILIGAVLGTFVSYNGHRLFSFAPGSPRNT